MHTIHPASHDANPNNVGAYFLANSLHSTGRKYTFCVLVPACIVCTIAVCCVLGWVEQLTKRMHIYHFCISSYCLVSWIHVRVKRDRFFLWCNNYETRCASLLACRLLAPVSKFIVHNVHYSLCKLFYVTT